MQTKNITLGDCTAPRVMITSSIHYTPFCFRFSQEEESKKKAKGTSTGEENGNFQVIDKVRNSK